MVILLGYSIQLDGIMKVEGTKLTSKKYSGVSGGITVKVNTNGQVSINGVPES